MSSEANIPARTENLQAQATELNHSVADSMTITLSYPPPHVYETLDYARPPSNNGITEVFPAELSDTDMGPYRRILLKADPHCRYCGSKVIEANSNIDHVLPRSRGGRNNLLNLVLTCVHCNNAKDSLTVSEWLDMIRGTVDRLQLLQSNLQNLIDAGFECYAPKRPYHDVPRGALEHIPKLTIEPSKKKKKKKAEPQQSSLEPVGPGPLRRIDFRHSRTRFTIIRKTDNKVLIRDLISSDVSHYLEHCGFDNNGPIALIGAEYWHPKIGGAFLPVEFDDDLSQQPELTPSIEQGGAA